MGSQKLTIDVIKTILNEHKHELEERFKVREIGLFGSIVRDEADDDSDIDMLVSFSDNVDYFEFLDLEEYLSVLLGMPVDLIEKNALKPHIGERVLNEVVMM